MCIAGQIPRDSTDPITIGHEACGKVVQVGSQVQGFKEGDAVGFINAYHACWSCKGCDGHFMLCNDTRMRMQGFNSDGYFQEYCAIDPASAVVLPSGMDAQDSAPIFCAGITGMVISRGPQLNFVADNACSSLSSYPCSGIEGQRDFRGDRLRRPWPDVLSLVLPDV